MLLNVATKTVCKDEAKEISQEGKTVEFQKN